MSVSLETVFLASRGHLNVREPQHSSSGSNRLDDSSSRHSSHVPSHGPPTTSRNSADTASAATATQQQQPLRNSSSRYVHSTSSSRDATAAAVDCVQLTFTVSSCRQIPLHLQEDCPRNMGGNNPPANPNSCFVPGTRTVVVFWTMNLSTVQQ